MSTLIRNGIIVTADGEQKADLARGAQLLLEVVERLRSGITASQ